jgi:hypothetical protein
MPVHCGDRGFGFGFSEPSNNVIHTAMLQLADSEGSSVRTDVDPETHLSPLQTLILRFGRSIVEGRLLVLSVGGFNFEILNFEFIFISFIIPLEVQREAGRVI